VIPPPEVLSPLRPAGMAVSIPHVARIPVAVPADVPVMA
jgi:hypothetical protein